MVISEMLPDVRKLVGAMTEALLARSTNDAGLPEVFHQIEHGCRTAQTFKVWREDSLDQVAVAWVAGWNHLEQATALIAYYDTRKREGWDVKRLTPLVAGLDQLLPWIHQWHPKIDTEYGETAGKSYQAQLDQDVHELGLTIEDIRQWTPPAKASKIVKEKKSKVK